MRIRLNDGNYEYIDSPKKLNQLIEKYIGIDAANVISEKFKDLSEQADYTSRKLETDLDSYEGSIEEQSSAAEDMDEGITEAIKYIKDSKRMDKSKLTDILNQAHKIYYENF